MFLKAVIAGVILFQAAVWASIQNARFEIPDPNQATPYFTPPLSWDIENYAGLHSHFTPEPEYGQDVQWTLENPVEGNSFCLLSTGDITGPGSDSQITRSSIRQEITLFEGDVLIGFYYFGTCDYSPYNDTAYIKLSPLDPNDGLRDILLASISVADVGNYSSTEEWLRFSQSFDANTAGNYILSCEVLDVRDTKYKTYLAIDNFRVCSGVPEYGDINFDCTVDLNDYNIFSSLWLSDCNDPNTFDPNFICTDADFNRNWVVEPNDLILMCEHWLENYWIE